MSCNTCGANLTDGSGDGTNGHWQNCTTPYGHPPLKDGIPALTGRGPTSGSAAG
jgi:hypothetical protein